ncbi:diacylglycerol kinase, alpha b isoform X3 [Sinocyclocheilus grahami]|uniref:diacylglycerol kinase, alpha b isoform X3 n=1 Tax=Sinocyclocheilus grahami TaxID=75366 RepID=UPI0007AD4AEA|nr:PREDICTED: diacylglycerol kinase alpha-like isoform X3 [Sinocyclocheilus grahami]
MATESDLENEISPVDFIQLQEYIEYGRIKVKDAMKEFHAGGKLVHHRFGDHIDATGFSLFLKKYLEVEDFPADFCQRLYWYFQRSEQCCPDQSPHTKDDCVSLKAVSCYFSILEDGNPRDKLEFDKIVTQMMQAAEYLGWDVTEVKPVLRDMLKAIDIDSSGTLTQQEWIQGGLNNIPLLVLLGLKVAEKDGQHVWRLKNFNRPTYCFVCQNMMLGLRKQGLSCNFCKYTVHSSCANKNRTPCVRTFVRSKTEIGCSVHDWISADCESNKCEICHKKIKMLTGKSCAWCHRMRHSDCVPLGSSHCDCGLLQHHILPPWAICAMDSSSGCSLGENYLANINSDGHFLQIFPVNDTHPLLVFVNPKSGGKQGKRVLRKFQYLLNPRQVYNLENGGPNPGLQFFQNLHKCRVLVCGGDGTVGWILDAIDKADMAIRPPVAILPLGTGNDLARCLHWGGGYEGTGLTEIIKQIEESIQVQMDRWSLQVIPADMEDEGDPVPNDIINNYFSLGVDASIAHQFHVMREKHPQKFNSRARNKLWYFQLATSETISASCRNLKECLTIECCGVPVELSRLSLEGIAVLNIPSMHGGSNLWGETKSAEKLKKRHEVTVDPDALEMCSQYMNDKLLEVVGLESVVEMGQIYTGLKSKAHRLAQAAHITIRTYKTLPMQIDGEPWMQPPCTIHITHKNQANMLMAPPAKSLGCFPK